MFPIKNIEISTINCGIKYKNRDDLLLVKLPEGTKVAGVFTTSSTAAAPVKICQENLKNGSARALIVNAGNANAFTGKHGMEAANKICHEVANKIGCNEKEVFISSTGVIGERLKEDFIISALPDLVEKFSENKDIWENAAKAIMTTDLFPKFTSRKINIAGQEIVINGVAKGSGMIAPNMATMLAYVFTNANISATNLQKLLSDTNEKSFNSITVDSDTSTSDTALAFASGEGEELVADNLKIFKRSFKEVMLELAKMIVIDGEGATKLIEIEVVGAASKKAAKIVGLSIANSPLVKTAIAGNDPNWGRIIMAIGKSGEEVNQETIDIKIGDFDIVKNGELISEYDEKPVHQYLKGKEVKILVNLNLRQGIWKVWTCDLTEGYIKINKDYRS
ncbi:MAG: glutamate N-acetyltransferase/amino-acid N-acetyltransferase [Rickettsiales bacterium]|jgi:glutamate N-acetyltransferase/amino-acid N-acetyltransferase